LPFEVILKLQDLFAEKKVFGEEVRGVVSDFGCGFKGGRLPRVKRAISRD
jgi:hypothetical protein